MTRYVTKQIKKQQQQQQPTKGLRLFSKQVCDKVAERGVTTYNEVADELTAEIRGHGHDDGGSSRSRALVDQKNIRRRVYDALNVLMAMNIITKDRKQIKWLGIPTSGPGLQYLKEEIQQEESRQQYLLASIQNSTLLLDDTLRHLARLKHLIQRNHQRRYTQQSCHLPFFIVTSNQPIYTEELSRDGKQALLNLGSSWMIKQDRDVLAKLWPGTTTL
ncbi:E2F/DP family winged-helix DNA-binding domain-containing protein [Cokeromyces recurvatus]|uniref:E2F/DP family winged-helix DNA-binding domain-containing protein n=1 Tax=Cokeromyces recurvatus TaxID=90255 RepID=UPI00221FF7B2|nr:E2F/DP family winged-helix DNA-binding domain-containing protein [Cokeromyces recurvatus]KAI7902519.1 E2F/DP family winged-helix DNA-binding domain-containing protein [Cokeromyces recurvatus]